MSENRTVTPERMRWVVEVWGYYDDGLTEALEDGWEPFAVTADSNGYTVWVKRQVPA